MISFEEVIEVEQDLKKSFNFLSDFSNLTDWDPGIDEVTKISDGVLRIGTEFEVAVTFMGNSLPMKYTLETLELNKKVVYKGVASNLEVIDTIEFEDNVYGTRILYKAEFEFKGALASFEKLFEYGLTFTAREAFGGMKKALSQPQVIKENTINFFLYKLLLPVVYDFSKFGYNSSKKNYRAIVGNFFNKTALVTGGSSGIGYESALKLARLGASVILVSKNIDKLKEAKEKIIKETGNANIYIEPCDLSLLNETKILINKIKDKFLTLDILINNAGALYNERTITGEGIEKTIALLLYSPFILTEGLLPLLKKSKSARIINVSSGGMYTAKLNLEDLESEENYNGSLAYARAKRGLVYLSDYWASIHSKDGVKSYSMHPGWADTEAVRNSLPIFYEVTKYILRSPKAGADTVIWLACSEEAETTNGGFWLDREKQPINILDNTVNSDEEINILINNLMKLKDRYS